MSTVFVKPETIPLQCYTLKSKKLTLENTLKNISKFKEKQNKIHLLHSCSQHLLWYIENDIAMKSQNIKSSPHTTISKSSSESSENIKPKKKKKGSKWA